DGPGAVRIGENDTYKGGYNTGFYISDGDPTGTVYMADQPMIELVLGYTGSYPASEFDVTFNVTDGTDAIEGATVNVGGKTGVTDASGDAIVPLEPGQYSYTVENSGYGDITGNIEVVDAALTEDVVMNMEYMTYFEATNEAGDVVSNVKINIDGEQLTTGGDGVDSVALVNGTYDYMVSLLGYDTLTGSVTVADAEQTVEIQLTQSMPYTVDFTVTDLEATPIEGATLTFGGTDYTTDASGLVSVSAPFGSSVYTVAATGYQTLVGSVVVTESMQKTVELNPLHMLTINVEDAAGTAIEGATVTIDGMDAQTTDASGVVTYEVIDGTYEATASMEGYVDNSTTVEVAGADASGTITLTGVYTVTFEVTEDEVPVQNANIEINNTFIATDVDGIATIDLDGGQSYPYTVIYSAYSEGDTINNLSADTTITINFTGINSVNALQFDVYPNPTSGQFTIEAQGQANVTIMNAAGKVVETMVINGTQQVNLNVASGVYFVRMKEADKVGVQRLIVE
ncbi:T9SS type A sorting domain-containing protein, partial [Salinivirga cyanobacteriivorans]